MGNPHPTKSKPNKIGRKHVNGLRVWQKAGMVNSARIEKDKIRARYRKLKNKIRQYFNGEIDAFPKDNK